MTATTVPVFAVLESVFTITIDTMFPVIVDPDFVAELETRTAMYAGTVSGGFELLPVPAVQVPPTVGGVVLVESAKPLKLEGAEPPLMLLTLSH